VVKQLLETGAEVLWYPYLLQKYIGTNTTMSFGFSIGDFLAVIQLANKIRKDFASAPREFKGALDVLVTMTQGYVFANVYPESEASQLSSKTPT